MEESLNLGTRSLAVRMFEFGARPTWVESAHTRKRTIERGGGARRRPKLLGHAVPVL